MKRKERGRPVIESNNMDSNDQKRVIATRLKEFSSVLLVVGGLMLFFFLLYICDGIVYFVRLSLMPHLLCWAPHSPSSLCLFIVFIL